MEGQKYPGAARQTFGSKSIQSIEDPVSYKKRHRPKTNRDRPEDDHQHGHGIVKYGIGLSSDPIPKTRFPNPNAGYGQPFHGPPDQMYELFNHPKGERSDTNYGGRLNHRGGHNVEEYNPSQFTEDIDDMAGNHNSGANDEEGVCEITCESQQFTCSKSCVCIHGDLHCDGQINCGPDGEDEIDCELTEEGIKKIRMECESSPNHIMCPSTFICISEKWLCDGKFIMKIENKSFNNPHHWLFLGDDDCGDWSDETNCGKLAKIIQSCNFEY